jgi:hypothetical protein
MQRHRYCIKIIYQIRQLKRLLPMYGGEEILVADTVPISAQQF